jgi:hypothetical protein
LERAKEAGVDEIICIGTSVEDSRAALEFAEAHEGVYATVGVHPEELSSSHSSFPSSMAQSKRSAQRDISMSTKVDGDSVSLASPLDSRAKIDDSGKDYVGESTTNPSAGPTKRVAKPASSASDSPETKEAIMAKFDWEELLEDIKENRPAIYTILSKCGHTLKDGELEIYAKNKLWKSKLDTAAFRKRIAEHGGGDLEVTVLAKAAPTGNGMVDAIADIMGGGEVVKID